LIGLDTNILVRFLTADDPEHSPRAHAFLHAAGERQEPLFVNVVVLCELAWSLRGKAYGYTRTDIANALDGFLNVGAFQIQHRDQVKAAVLDYRQGKADFADYLIGHLNSRAGCQSTVTFDQALADTGGFQPL